MASFFVYPTVHGPVTLQASEKGLCRIEFGEVALEGARRATNVSNRAATQLQEYLAGKRRAFNVPLDEQGSSFQRAVWHALGSIPYGETRTATQIAQQIGKPGAQRSVGAAIRQCTLAPFVPAHRILTPNDVSKQADIFRAFQTLEARNR